MFKKRKGQKFQFKPISAVIFTYSSSHVGKILKLLFLAASIKTMLEAQIACFIYW